MIEDIFLVLRDLGECRTASAFSRDYLGMESNYFRGTKWRDREPSAKALAHCAAKLRVRADCFGASQMVALTQRGDKLRQLSDDCVEVLLGSFETKMNP